VSTKRAARRKTNVFQRLVEKIQQLWRETIGELRKVSWPTRQEAMNLTKIVLIVIFAMSLFLGALDVVFGRVFAVLLGA
jgi:preprotein translocase subunit SecE